MDQQNRFQTHDFVCVGWVQTEGSDLSGTAQSQILGNPVSTPSSQLCPSAPKIVTSTSH